MDKCLIEWNKNVQSEINSLREKADRLRENRFANINLIKKVDHRIEILEDDLIII